MLVLHSILLFSACLRPRVAIQIWTEDPCVSVRNLLKGPDPGITHLLFLEVELCEEQKVKIICESFDIEEVVETF